MKGITFCGECVYYSTKKHRCTRSATDDSDPKASFYADCPLPDVAPVVYGQWRKVYTCHGEQAWGYECDQCKADNPRATYYCPNCGAKMDGDRNG